MALAKRSATIRRTVSLVAPAKRARDFAPLDRPNDDPNDSCRYGANRDVRGGAERVR
jgi:hypothetical protein